jgi:23S rRNA pseudouridine2605 synthase
VARRNKSPEAEETPRLQAYLARAGVASRRASEELIREGRVTVNGQRAEIGSKVQPSRDIVRVDGRIVKPLAQEWIALHKPRGYVTTRDDPRGRKTVYDLLPPELHHLFHVGRLDRDSSGLLLLTNDGETANRLLHPRYGATKEYRVDIEGKPGRSTLEQLTSGVELDDGTARAVAVEPRGEVAPGIYRLVVVLREGRNREVRRMMEHLGHPVRRLLRLRFGPIELEGIGPGRWRRLERQEIASLRKPGPTEKRS